MVWLTNKTVDSGDFVVVLLVLLDGRFLVVVTYFLSFELKYFRSNIRVLFLTLRFNLYKLTHFLGYVTGIKRVLRYLVVFEVTSGHHQVPDWGTKSRR